MPLINKEPYITPEMISAWNAGGGGLSNKTLICDKELSKSDISSSGYSGSKNLTSSEISTLASATNLYFEMYYNNGSSGYNMLNAFMCNLDLLKTNASTYQIRGGYTYPNTVGMFNWYLQAALDNSGASLAVQMDSNFYATMGASAKIRVKVYKI